MSDRTLIRIRRGPIANIPILGKGELAWCTDTNELFIGDGVANQLLNPPPPTPPPGAGVDTILLEHRLANNSNGGTATGGSWNLRPLNALTVDTGGFCSLASNQFTLDPGKYAANIWSAGNHIEFSKIRLYSVTDSDDGGRIGASVYVFNQQLLACLFCFLDIAIATTYQVEHWAQTTQSTYGLGQPVNNGTDEIFCQALLTKVG